MITTVGLDLDNTLVTYDALFHTLGTEQGLIRVESPRQKRHIRDFLRESADGEQQWRTLQGLAYGARMGEAALSDGVEPFLLECRQRGVTVHIVSHRTLVAAADPGGINLHDAAMDWMTAHRFFEANGLGLLPSNVWFEQTRTEKVARIRRLRCTHFVDDLEEVLLDPDFPPDTSRILYAPDGGCLDGPDGLTLVRTWAAAREAVFGRR